MRQIVDESHHRDRVHQRDAGDLVFTHSNHVGRRVRGGLEQGIDSLDALQGRLRGMRQHSEVLGTRCITKVRSSAQGLPPRCVCPRVVTRESRPRRSVRTFLT